MKFLENSLEIKINIFNFLLLNKARILVYSISSNELPDMDVSVVNISLSEHLSNQKFPEQIDSLKVDYE